MKVTVIHGSPRRNGNTQTAAALFLAAMRRCGSVETTEFFLPKDMPEFCRGCMTCVLRGEEQCPHAAHTLPILRAMLDADALLFTTPVYVMAESGAMKNFLDHYPYLYIVHRARSEMFTKKAFVLVTALGAGQKNAIRTVRTSLRFWGVNRVYSAGCAMHDVEWDKIAPKHRTAIERKIEKSAVRFYREVQSKKRHRPYLFLHFMVLFLRWMIPNYDDGSLDKKYWLSNGWLKRSPFAPQTEKGAGGRP